MKSLVLKSLLYFLIISLPAGAFMLHFRLVFFEVYGFRIAIVSCFLFFLFSRKLVLYRNKLTKAVSLFFVFWILYACLSLIWSPDKSAAVIEISYIVLGALVYLTLLSFKTHYLDFEKDLNSAWVITLVVVFSVSVWEIFTEKHIVSNFTETLVQLGIFHELHSVPVFTFDNLNHYSIYISFSLVLLLTQLLQRKNQLLNGILVSAILYLVILFHSRFGELFFGISIICFFGLMLKHYYPNGEYKKKLVGIAIVAGVLVVGVFGFNNTIRVHADLKREFLANAATEGQVPQSHVEPATPISAQPEPTVSSTDTATALPPVPPEHVDTSVAVATPPEQSDTVVSAATNDVAEVAHLSSNEVRKNLILNGFHFLKQSHFLGTGAGSFKVLMSQGKNLYDTSGIINPHNYFIEIIAQYGLIIMLLFILLFLYTIKILSVSAIKIGINSSHFFVALATICYAIMSNANSSFLPLPLNWFVFALLMIQADDLLTVKTT